MKKISCIVPDCVSVDSQHDANTKFHQIPKDPEVRKKWLKAIKRTESEVNKRSKVCSKHFKNEDYALTRLNYGIGGEFTALKTEAVPNMNLPPKSTFKIKISKKDNNKQIKVEEIKVKEEKVEKSERIKMPKRPAPPDSPPRSRTQSRRAASKEALKQMQLLLDDENDATEIPDDELFDIMQVLVSPSPVAPPPKKKHKVGHRKSAEGTPKSTDRDAVVLQTITNRDAENTLELDCWVEQPEQIYKDRRKKFQDEQKELQDKLDALVAEHSAKVIFKSESNTIIEICEQVRSAIEGSEKPPTSVIINNNYGGEQSYDLLMDPSLGLITSEPTQITPPTAPPPVVPVTPQKTPQPKIQVAQNLQQPAPSPAPSTARVATRRARASTSKNTPPVPVSTPPTRSKATPVQNTPPIQAPPTRNQTRAQAQATPVSKQSPATSQTRAQVQPPPTLQTRAQVQSPATPQTRGQVQSPATPQTRGQVQSPATTQTRGQVQSPATPQTRGQVQNTPQTRGQNAQTRGQNTSRAQLPPPPQPAQTRAQAAAATTTPQTRGKKQVNTRARGPGSNTFTTSMRPSEGNVEGGLSTGNTNVVEVDLTSTDEETSKLPPDSREIAFNKLQGKTYPSLVVVARPHLRAKDLSMDRPKLDAKVKSVLMHAPPKFTEWLIQQGLIRSEQKCTVHTNTQLKLGMYSDVSKFPYSGGYVWISECCPQRFVSVFSGSLFEGSPHPPVVILKLLYHWACQTNIQNVVQWVKVDNLYVKGMFTWLRSICTVGLQTHFRQLGGPGVKVEVGVISLGTSSQDGSTRQVKVEVLGVLESESKLIRLRAVEPQTDGDKSIKKRFSKMLEPLISWVHPHSMLVADMTVDKQALYNMGFTNVVVSTVVNNNQIMEYLRRIVPRMFQNTLSLLSRQIIQQFLDELVWREWFGTSSLQAFDSLVQHLAEQTRYESGMSLIVRLNKVAQNPFKSWNMVGPTATKAADNNTNNATTNANNSKKSRNARKPEPPKANQVATVDINRPPKSTSPDVPEQMVPLESYYYGTIETYPKAPAITLNMKCPFCKNVFDNNLQLMSHLFKHAHNVSMDAQLCRYCLTSVATANDLLKHIASSHPAETKFDNGFCCLICETHYMNPFVLGKHMSKEHFPSELPYQCGTCFYRCSNHKQAIDHFYKAHDNGSTIQCPFCLKSTTVFSSSRNIVQNLNYFIQHLQKHQRKNLARRCGKCNSWFVQKDILNDHQKKMHVSQRGKPELVPWTAPRNGIMVPKSKMDKYPVDAEVIDFDALKLDLSKGLMCKECDTPMDTPKHFPSFESCQNPNCQYSTCCTNAMQEHNAKCNKTNTPIAEEKLPFEMFCICGFSHTDGNQMARHLAICERKSAYPSRADAKSATVTHSMLDVLGLVRRAEEIPKPDSIKADPKPASIASDSKSESVKLDDSRPRPKTEKRKRARAEESATNSTDLEVVSNEVKENEVETENNRSKRRRTLLNKVVKEKPSTEDVVAVDATKVEDSKNDDTDNKKENKKDKPQAVEEVTEQQIESLNKENEDVDMPLDSDKPDALKSEDNKHDAEEAIKKDDTEEPMEQNLPENVEKDNENTPKDVEKESGESNLPNHVEDTESTTEGKLEEDNEHLDGSKDDVVESKEVKKDDEEANHVIENEIEDKDCTEVKEGDEDASSEAQNDENVEESKQYSEKESKEEKLEKSEEEKLESEPKEDNLEKESEINNEEENVNEESREENLEESKEDNLDEESREENLEESKEDNVDEESREGNLEEESRKEHLEVSKEDNLEEESQERNLEKESREENLEDSQEGNLENESEERDLTEKSRDNEESQDGVEDENKDDKEIEEESKDNEFVEGKEYSEDSQDLQSNNAEEAKVDEEESENKDDEEKTELKDDEEETELKDDEEETETKEDEEEAEAKEDEEETKTKDDEEAEIRDDERSEQEETEMTEHKEPENEECNVEANEDVAEDKEEDATEDNEEEATEDKEEEENEEINKDEQEVEKTTDVPITEQVYTNREHEECSEKDGREEGEEKAANEANVEQDEQYLEKDIGQETNEVADQEADDLDNTEKQSEDLNASENQTEDVDTSEKQSNVDISEKQSLDFEGPEDITDLQNHVTDDSMETTDRPPNKESDFSSDAIQSLLSHVTSETESDSKPPQDAPEMMDVADSSREGSTPMDTD